MRTPNDDCGSEVIVPDTANACAAGWNNIAARLQQAIAEGRNEKPILVVECYPGVDELALLNELKSRLSPALIIHAADAFLPPPKIDALIKRFFNLNDPASSSFSTLSLVHFFHAEPLWRFRRIIEDLKEGLVLIVGCGASLIAWGHVLVYADLTRWEAQRRLQRDGVFNLGANDKSLSADSKYQRAFFVDWPMADRWKRPLIDRWDFILDTSHPDAPKLADAEAVRLRLQEATRGPFRLAPNPDGDPKTFPGNFKFALDENSLPLGFGKEQIEIPLLNVAFHQPRRLLGEAAFARFNYESSVRFNSHSESFYLNPGVGRGSWRRLSARDWMNRFKLLSRGDGWREEKSSLSGLDFVEMRRRWFTANISTRTHDTLHVISLVEGGEIFVESPTDAFAPLAVRDAETFVVPAAVGEYIIRSATAGRECVTLKFFVRA